MRTLRTAPALAAGTWHCGFDSSGGVQVELDGPGRDVRVVVGPGWRSVRTPDTLGAAVVAAHTEASIARLTAWATDGIAGSDADPAMPQRRSTLDSARREMAVFRRRIAELRAAPVTVAAPEGGIRVTVRDGWPVALHLERSDLDDPQLEERLAAALRVALAAVADQPAQALAGCPDLLAVLGSSGTPLPFTL